MSKYVLMNKNTEVALIDYNTDVQAIVSIDSFINKEFAPLSVSAAKSNHISELKALNQWFKGRGIPSWRDNLDSILINLKIDAPEELLDKAFALSLSDQYWIKPIDSNINWKDINFFDNDFDSASFADATFSSLMRHENINFNTPNNTSDGMLKKAWIMKGNERILIKGGYKKSMQEPLNERLATLVSKKMNFEHVNYEVTKYNEAIVSACKCFITPDTELIYANDIIQMGKRNNNINEFNYYISILEEHGIINAREQLENMIVVDYLLMNEDRHTRNFGIIRNVNTLQWEKVAPIYDTGQSMNTQREFLDFNFTHGSGKLFSNTNYDFDKMLSLISDFTRFNVDCLCDVAEEWAMLLQEWKSLIKMDDTKVMALTNGFNIRVNKLKEYIKINSKKSILMFNSSQNN